MEKISLQELLKRKLEETYLAVFAIKNEISLKKNDNIEKATIYSLMGIDLNGTRSLLGIVQEKESVNRYWLDCFESLKNRGLKNILFLSVDDNKNIKRTAKIAFPNIVFIDSIVFTYLKFRKFMSLKAHRVIAKNISGLYTQKTLEEYKSKFEMFKYDYNNEIFKTLIEKYLNNVEFVYKYSQNIRKMLFLYMPFIDFFDKIRYKYNEQYSISSINELIDDLDKSETTHIHYKCISKKDLGLVLNDLSKIYKDIDFI